MANFNDERVLLTLAALTYRGFQDVLGGSLHEEIVSGAVFDGLQTLAPVKDEWDLIWGPATDRDRGLAIDTNMMYVARSLSAPNRLVVAIRGTNPLSLPDWVFGDFWVGETVAWPYATAAESAVVSKSTALGLAALQSMRSRKPATSTIAQVSARVTRALTTLGRAARGGPADLLAATPARFEAQVKRIGELWQDAAANATPFEARRQAADALPIAPAALRPKLAADAGSDDRSDLLTLLRAEAKESGATALEVVVTGHSKGGALAQAVALWLKDALDSADPQEIWDPSQRATVACYAFAGPTPGNAGFAQRIERVLGERYHHLRNMNDIVTRAWQVDELREIPALYGTRSAPFKGLVGLIVADVEKRDYRQAKQDVPGFKGGLADTRTFPAEFVHQHLQSYIDRTGLDKEGISAETFFL